MTNEILYKSPKIVERQKNFLRQKRLNEWRQRCLMQYKYSVCSLFFTLTYDDRHLTFGHYTDSTFLYRDFQLFVKRLRKRTQTALKYMVVSEYTPTTGRPHFHGILYFLDKPPISDLRGCSLSDYITDCWQNGFSYCSWTESPKAISYVIKYISKDDKIPDGCCKPIFKCSQGIGLEFIFHNKKRIYEQFKENFNTITFREHQGTRVFKYRVCRYYRRKLYGSRYDCQRYFGQIGRQDCSKNRADLVGHYIKQIARRLLGSISFQLGRGTTTDMFYRRYKTTVDALSARLCRADNFNYEYRRELSALSKLVESYKSEQSVEVNRRILEQIGKDEVNQCNRLLYPYWNVPRYDSVYQNGYKVRYDDENLYLTNVDFDFNTHNYSADELILCNYG